jgi:NADH:ubiquinone oxidoreductase subunit 5 (subunit L)/multisubunit Na+/H+ antiporter MnhA subunit
MTSVLFLAPDHHDLPRQAALRRKDMAHVHESPLVMTAPLFVLAVGAVFAGYLMYEAFVGHDGAAFWNGALFAGAGESLRIWKTPTMCRPGWCWRRFVGVAGILRWPMPSISAPGIPGQIAGRFRALYLFLLNKWYFDELYDFGCSCVRASIWAANMPHGRAVDVGHHVPGVAVPVVPLRHRRPPDFQFVEYANGCPRSESPITWASTAFRCCSCC